jgi:hypothetical protein
MGLFFVVVVVTGIYALTLGKRLAATEKASEQQIHALKRELAVVNSAAMGVGQRLINVDKQLKLSIEKQQQREMTNVDYLHYSQAPIVSPEVDADQLADRYGLPEAEADLLALLQTAAK